MFTKSATNNIRSKQPAVQFTSGVTILSMTGITILDRLYGSIEFTADDLKLFQTPELTRLRQVSLTAIPYWLLPVGICSTKFEHSLGCAYLASRVISQEDFKAEAQNIWLASLLHDIGTPPFSHASEYFQEKVFGQNHEAYATEMLQGKQLNRLISQRGGDMDTILNYITGEQPPFSDLINGSIDIDNLDNSLRFGYSMGLFQKLNYSPEKLADGYRFIDRQVCLQLENTSQLEGWEMCRQAVYNFVYSAANLSPGMMLYRAMDFAYRHQELTKTYFHMTDEQAFRYLETECNQQTRYLINQVKHWQFYEQAYAIETNAPSRKLKQLAADITNRAAASDQLASILKTRPENVAVYFRANKAHKDIHLPTIDANGKPFRYSQHSQASWIAQVYVHPDLMLHQPAIQEFMEELLK